MNFRYDERTIIITGAGAGLGEVYARELARRGASVVITDLTDSAEAVAESIRDEGGSAISVRGSVTSPKDAQRTVDETLKIYGRVDGLINNAGIGFERPFIETALEDIRKVMDVNFFGAANMTQAVWPHMTEQRYGRILNITSANIFGLEGWSAYGAAKAAELGLARGLAVEGEALGIKVNVMAPAALTTMLTDNIKDPDILASVVDAKPELVGPMAAYLVHEDVPFTGRTLFSGSGHISDIYLVTSRGANLADNMTVESVAEAIAGSEFHGDLTITNRTVEQSQEQIN